MLCAFRTTGFHGLKFLFPHLEDFMEYLTRAEMYVYMARARKEISCFAFSRGLFFLYGFSPALI
jgi:hypothetical protein